MLNAASPPAKWSCKPHEGAFWPPAKTQAMLGRLENTPAPRSKKRKTGNLPEIEVSQPKLTDPLKPRRNRPRVFCGHIIKTIPPTLAVTAFAPMPLPPSSQQLENWQYLKRYPATSSQSGAVQSEPKL
jgi:hypothetical protein